MKQAAVVATRISKRYRKGPRIVPTLRDWVTYLTGKQTGISNNAFFALKNISFELKRGETVGIIGRNGAGKSTLLKLISKVIYPTSGTIRADGVIAGLLELGAGFHPELTGRENIYFQAAILGMSRRLIQEKVDEIIEFSELAEFMDTPVKYYSSGMYARLGFSVAMQMDPDIFLIDEVLSVGDAQFQKKCIDRVKRYFQGKKTVIFVSHNLEDIKRLCQRVIWLEKGEVAMDGRAEEVIKTYVNVMQS